MTEIVTVLPVGFLPIMLCVPAPQDTKPALCIEHHGSQVFSASTFPVHGAAWGAPGSPLGHGGEVSGIGRSLVSE